MQTKLRLVDEVKDVFEKEKEPEIKIDFSQINDNSNEKVSIPIKSKFL